MFSRTTFCVLLCALIQFSGVSAEGERAGQPRLNRVEISIADATLDVEIAATPRQRYHGLSFRKSLADSEAMLFVYQREKKLLFTMRDTSIPLSIAFIDKHLVINEILDMTPFDDGPYASTHPSMYALETNQGWFERQGITPGTRLALGARIRD